MLSRIHRGACLSGLGANLAQQGISQLAPLSAKGLFKSNRSKNTVLFTGTAQAATPYSVTLPATATSQPDFYAGSIAHIVGSTGAGLSGSILTSRTNLLTNSTNMLGAGWNIRAGTTIGGVADVLTGTALAGASSTMTLPSTACVSPDGYAGRTLTVTGGTGSGQTRNITASRKNLIPYSQAFDSAAWVLVNATVAANNVVAPDGTTTADTLTASVGGVTNYVYQQVTLLANTTYTISVYAKASGTLIGKTSELWMWFGGTATVVGGGNGIGQAVTWVANGTWTRYTSTFTTVNAGTAYLRIDLSVPTDAVGDAAAYWGAQLEVGTTATTYIHTETSPAVGATVDVPWSTNLATHSEDMSFWTMDGVGDVRTLNVGLDGNGVMTLDQLTASTTSGQHRFYEGIIVVPNSTYTFSLDARQTASTEHLLMFFYDGVIRSVSFNLTTGAVIASFNGATGSAVSLGGGLWRCSITATPTISTPSIYVYRTDITGVIFTTGDGINGIQVGRAQVNLGTVATPYIATTISPISLVPDATSTFAIGGLANQWGQNTAQTVTVGAGGTDDIWQTTPNIPTGQAQHLGLWIKRISTSGNIIMLNPNGAGGNWYIDMSLLPAGWIYLTEGNVALTGSIVGIGNAGGVQFTTGGATLQFLFGGCELETGVPTVGQLIKTGATQAVGVSINCPFATTPDNTSLITINN